MFVWEIVMLAPKGKRARKNLEVLFIAVQKPSLNDLVKSNVLQTASHK